MLKKVLSAIRRHRLIVPGQHVLVAVSGGADSMALLEALRMLSAGLRLKLTVAHLNHMIRGAAADADAVFVRNAARRRRCRCIVGRVNVPALAKRKGLSVEMAAREARYEFLCREARRAGAHVIATAHHADDQAETVLIHFLRGAGTRGLSGIPRAALHEGVPVVRPLLDVRREEIVRFLNRRRLKWRDDSTNDNVAHLRNRVRHELLPWLEKNFNPAIRQVLIRMSDIFREEDRWLDAAALETLQLHTDPVDGLGLMAKGLAAESPAMRRRVIRLWLARGSFPPERIDFDTTERIGALLRTRKGTGAVSLPGGWSVRRWYGIMNVVRPGPLRTCADATRLAVPGTTSVPSLKVRVMTAKAVGIVRPGRSRPGDLPASASLSPDALGKRQLCVRAWRPGDRMRPFGMAGSRKLQDIFTDARVPRDRRSRVPVFECEGEIVWIPGYRIARGWEVLDAARPAIQITCRKRTSNIER